MSKKVRLTPELEQRYREWLKAQRAAGLAYAQEDGELATQPLTDADSASIEKWMREADVAGVEFEEEGEFEDEAPPAPPAPSPDVWSKMLAWWRERG
jgi:hypothetical protein